MPPSPTDHPIVLFDGVCNLCNRCVQFIVRRDPDARFRFAALQSPAGESLLAQHDLPPGRLESIVMIQDGVCYTKSDAALRIARGLSGGWRAATVLRIVPRPVRDWAYDLIARNRYRWFGRRDTCMVPTTELAERFLE